MGLVWAFHDITDHVTSEKELLRVSKLEAVGVLAGGIAHDFNNLLVAILGSIDLSLEYLSPDHEAHELLKAAEQASVRARDLTGQLLTFSAGGDPVKEIASLGEVIRDSTDFVLRGTNVACDYEISKDLWLVDVDTSQMSQVIQNLALNAKAAMPKGGRIEIRAGNERRQSEEAFLGADQASYVRISVSDQGVGIPRDVIERVFDPYFSTSSGGSGLGLAVAHSIVKKHDGRISVESEPGKGSCFTILLPAAESQAVASSEISQGDFQGGGLVIVMDDDPNVQETASAMLRRLGFDVALANDGQEALAIYERSKDDGRSPAAVIMDLTIPGGMGGVLAVEKILAFDPDARVVVSSGYSTDPAMAHCEEYGFRASLIKPFTLKEMSRVLQSVLR